MANKKRLIDANWILGEIEHDLGCFEIEGFAATDCLLVDLKDIIRMVCAAPIVDAVEVVRAYWDEDGRCSHCKEEAITEWSEVGGEYIFTRFCPFCGASMDADEAEQPEERV